MHYGESLSYMFNTATPEAQAVIIVEDDLLFSPDFLDYFEALSPVTASLITIITSSLISPSLFFSHNRVSSLIRTSGSYWLNGKSLLFSRHDSLTCAELVADT